MLSKIHDLLNQSLIFYSKKGLKSSLNDKNSPLLIQIIKYGFCGLLTTIVHIFIVYALGLTINPAIGEHISKDLKESRTIINNVFTFLISNTIAFKLNVKFVFNSGRHSKTKEIILFFTVSGVSFFAGLLSIPLVFELVDTNKGIEHLANGAFIISSALMNFLCRKYIIFAK
ncbi:MAG: GtrA family protein [Akkermansiaceae bacterium]|nr:GtrA family protein [Akkermansiaceae bacterium]MDG1853827.1 GtrA family protein [Verrucomicrobiales bacterium]